MTSTAAHLTCQLDNAFWRFSLNVYQHNSVKESLLSFQHAYHTNTNVLLFCCWLAYAVEDISQNDLLSACHALDDWQENVTEGLRSIRNWIKSSPKTGGWINHFYQLILMDEIVSETWQQHQLYSHVKHQQKRLAVKNSDQAIMYLQWVFAAQTIFMTDELSMQLNHLVELVYSHLDTETH